MPSTKTHAANGAQTLDRGLTVLDVLARAGNPLAVSEVAERCGLDKSTAHRLLATLVARGYVRQNARTRDYMLGLKLFDLYDALQQSLGFQEVCRPLLNELTETSGETSHMAVLDGTYVVFVDTVVTKHPMGVRTAVGRREPLYCTALGKAILALLPVLERESLLRHIHLEAFTPQTLVTEPALEEELALIRERGWALDDEEFLAGVRCMAAAVVDRSGRPLGAIGLSAPATRLSRECGGKLGPYLRRLAERASATMGGAPIKI